MPPQSREFHISDVLSITSGRMVSTRHMDGVFDILNYMTQDTLWLHQLPRASRECAPWLCRQHPWLESPAMQDRIASLDAMIASPAGKQDAAKVIKGWLADLIAEHGEMLAVSPIPRDDHERIDPVEEMRAMTNGTVIPVVIGSDTED